ncbi:MAG: BamA/TamA family outer membrane protein [Acidobacteria bacterium]|nr:BamA/TamA family outer membrane protein [Acidobacteriota bacterium]
MRVVPRILALLPLIACYAFCNQDSDTNVNSRYTVESVEIPPKAESKLSHGLKDDIRSIVGVKFSQEAVDKLTQRIKKELRGYQIAQKVTKGAKPESLRVIYEVMRKNPDFVVQPRLAYHSKQNFTFGAIGDFGDLNNRVSFGILTDNDELLERYSGFRGGYSRTAAGGKFRGGFVVESFHIQWSRPVESALAQQEKDEVPGIYRTRLHVSPRVQVEVLPGVFVGAGISLQRFQTQFPAARHESSNALISSLRFDRRWEPTGAGKHKLEAGYDLRAATRSLDSDFAYSRHFFHAEYAYREGKNSIRASFVGGALTGRAPLFDRFLLGNSQTLRGYNKFDIAPLGGNRMAHGSLDYRYRWFRTVYDTGTVYNRGGQSKVLHSLAAGFTTGHQKDAFSLLVAFPLRDGRMDPVFILGMSF